MMLDFMSIDEFLYLLGKKNKIYSGHILINRLYLETNLSDALLASSTP